jgi:hypothetical protein
MRDAERIKKGAKGTMSRRMVVYFPFNKKKAKAEGHAGSSNFFLFLFPSGVPHPKTAKRHVEASCIAGLRQDNKLRESSQL